MVTARWDAYPRNGAGDPAAVEHWCCLDRTSAPPPSEQRGRRLRAAIHEAAKVSAELPLVAAAVVVLWYVVRAPVGGNLRLAVVLALQVSTVDLTRRSWQHDRAADAATLPYGARVGFATALTTEIARRDRG